MKKIINGKLYDTDKAKFLGEWYNGAINSDIITEELYRKRTGEFFLSGSGGARTKYATSCVGGGWGGGSAIIPLSWDAAREWAEEHLDADVYQEIFGEIVEDDSRTTVTLSLSSGALERAKRAATQAGINLSAYIESLI